MLHKPVRDADGGRPVGAEQWAGRVGLAVAVGLAYFMAARFGLALRAEAGTSIFWPGAGVSVGALIVWGPTARVPVSAGVVVATAVSNLMIGRNAWLAVAFGFVNAGQALLTAGLIERWFERSLNLGHVSQVLGFLVAATIGAAVAAMVAATAIGLVESTGSPFTVWRVWFASCLLGIVTAAPLLIGIAEAVRNSPSCRELVEGAVGIVMLAALSAFVISLPEGPWSTALPVALVFPVLLWVGARYRPVFSAAAGFVVALTVIWSLTFGVGHFGDENIALSDRILAAQTIVLTGAVLTLVLAALFAERRRSEGLLNQSNQRLQLALAGADLGVWSVDLRTGCFESDARDRQINGHNPEEPPLKTLAQARTRIHPDDLRAVDALFAASARTGSSYKAEYRLVAAPGHKPAGRERWVAVEGTVVRGADGGPERLLGVTRDITERKLTEQRLQRSERESRELLGALPAAVYVTDAGGRITYCNERAVDLWGAKPKLGEDKWCDLCRFYHADGTLMPLEDCPTQIALNEGRVDQGRDSILERLDGTRVPIVRYPTPLHDGAGAIIGVVNIMMDITERQKTERALAERNLMLALAGKAGLVGSYTYDGSTDRMQVSEGYAAVHGLPEGTTESSRSEWEGRVHPADLARVKALRRQAFQERRCGYAVEYRIVCQGEVRWIESRSFISYNGDGIPKVIGVNIDITERRHAEARQRVLLAELDHRVKNALATVSAVASQTKDASGSMEEFVTALDGRIRSMAGAHELLSCRRWQGIPIASLLARELAAYSTSENVEIDGPEMILRPDAGQAMAMVLHELATNAAKYGALSTPSGRVSVRWSRIFKGGVWLVVDWRETGGLGIETPKKSGYGTSIIRDLIPYEFGGTVDVSFAPEGMQCRLEIPFDRISAENWDGAEPKPLHSQEPSAIQ